MKTTWKASILTAVITLISFNASAQLALGLKGGLNLSNFTEPQTDLNPSFHVGFELQYMLSKSLGIESGLYYNGLGAKLKHDLPNNEGVENKKCNIDYIQLPLSFLYKFRIANDVFMAPYIGGYASYGTGGRTVTKINSSDQETEYTSNFFVGGSDSQNFDAGASIGLNFEFENYFTHSTYDKETNKIIFGIGYERGFMNVKASDTYLAQFTKMYNQNIKLSLGFLF